METRTDNLLLDEMRSGNADGFSQLYSRYHERILRYCIRLLNDKAQAEDVAQNVFLKFHVSQADIRNGQSVPGWLFTVARNEIYNECAKKRASAIDETFVWNGDLPDDLLTMKQQEELVDAALSRMHLPFREVIMLRVYEQLSYEEIAAITGTTVSSVKSRLFKARKALIEKLHPFLDDLRP